MYRYTSITIDGYIEILNKQSPAYLFRCIGL